MPDIRGLVSCKECGDVGLTLPPYGVCPDFCTCDIGHELNDRAHDYAYSLEQLTEVS